jgi:hypothetical protein
MAPEPPRPGDDPTVDEMERWFAACREHKRKHARPSTILDPFAGAGTTLAVAEVLGRDAIGCELYPKNADLYPERKAIVAKEVAKYLAERGDAPSPASGAQQLTIEGIAAE